MLVLLGGSVSLVDAAPADDDWYANVLWLERRKCLLLTHAGTLFSIFVADVRAPELRPLGPYPAALVDTELRGGRTARGRAWSARHGGAAGRLNGESERPRLHERHGRPRR